MKRVFLLFCLLQFLVFTVVNGQNEPSFIFLHKTLIENEQLNSVTEFVQADADTPPVLNAIATIDRVTRQITIEYKRAKEGEESSSLYTYNEEGKPLFYVSYTMSGKQKNNERYSYLADGNVERRIMWQDTNEDTPKAERWTRLLTVSHYDDNNNLLDFSTKGVKKGQPFSEEGRYAYAYDDEGRKVEKTSLYQDSLSSEFVPFYHEKWVYGNDKIRLTSTQLKSGKEHVQTSWYEEGLLIKEKRRSDEENNTTQLTYENGLLKMKHSSGTNELGPIDTKWVYEYE